MVKVLIVDDERDLVSYLASFLKKQGFKVDFVYNGEEAKSKIEEFRPEVVLLDLIMPKIDGFKVLEWIRQNFKSTSVIILSHQDKLNEIKKGYELKADFYLPKPFTNSELLRGINTILSLRNYQKD